MLRAQVASTVLSPRLLSWEPLAREFESFGRPNVRQKSSSSDEKEGDGLSQRERLITRECLGGSMRALYTDMYRLTAWKVVGLWRYSASVAKPSLM